MPWHTLAATGNMSLASSNTTMVPRPIVIVEDHVYHIDRILDQVAQGFAAVLGQITVACLDRPGPDTDRAVTRWRTQYPALGIAARSSMLDTAACLDAVIFEQPHACHRAIGRLLRPGGLLLSDIHLETLAWLDRDKWTETIYLANAIRGTFAQAAPRCVFMSNKRGFPATFGRDLLDVGFDPRDVLSKDELGDTLVPLLRKAMRDAFPWSLRCTSQGGPIWMPRTEVEPHDVGSELDLILWPARRGRVCLSGRALATSKAFVELPEHGHEAATWHELLTHRLEGTAGVRIATIGERVADGEASQAERSNAAAKHLYALRKRLADPGAVATVDHHYRLEDELSVGIVTVRAE